MISKLYDQIKEKIDLYYKALYKISYNTFQAKKALSEKVDSSESNNFSLKIEELNKKIQELLFSIDLIIIGINILDNKLNLQNSAKYDTKTSENEIYEIKCNECNKVIYQFKGKINFRVNQNQ